MIRPRLPSRPLSLIGKNRTRGSSHNAPRRDLQPRHLGSCVNRSTLGRILSVTVGTTRSHRRPLSRLLLCNPPKLNGAAVTLVLTRRVKITYGVAATPTLRQPHSVTKLLIGLGPKSILFVSRVRHLPEIARRVLCPTVRSTHLSVAVNGKRSTHAHDVPLYPFALIKTAAHIKTLASPLHSHFKLIRQLQFCRVRRLARVILHATSILGATVRPAKTGRVTHQTENAPQVTGHLLHQIHSCARMGTTKTVARNVTTRTLRLFGISPYNLS